MATTQDFKDLWEEALEKYIESTGRTLREQDLLKQLKSPEDLGKQLEIDQGRFASFRAKHANLTSRVKKAVRPFTVLSAVASSAISLSPFAPASAIFGAVVFVIQAADGVSEAYDWLEELFDKLGDFTVRLDEYCKEGIGTRLGTKVVQVLGCLLEILARSEKIIKIGRWRKYAAVLFLGKDEEIKASFGKLAKLLEDEQRLVSAITFATNQRMDRRIEEIEQTVRETLEAVNNAEIGVDAIQQSQQRDIILQWISSTKFPSQQTDIINQKQKGTGQWFLDATEFRNWIRGSKQTLLCLGMPGAGKTVAAAIAIDHLSRIMQDNTNGVAYIYCNYKTQAEQNITVLLAAILRQLVQAQQSIPDPLLRLYDYHSRRATSLSHDEVVDTLKSILINYSAVHLVIDALDECLDSTRRQLLRHVRDLQKGANLNLMITSRFLPELEGEFEHATKLDIRANNEDVKSFVASQFSHLPKRISDEKELSLLVDKIVKAADGMFLLARLHTDLLLDSLQDTTTKKEVMSTLEDVSKRFRHGEELEQVYDQSYAEAVKRIENQTTKKRALARRAISWITYAERPLTTEELRHALAVEVGKTDLDETNIPDVEVITSVCAGLVVVDKTTNIIRFVHYTTQEYFERIRETWNQNAQLEIASACLAYLSFNPFRSGSCQSNEEFEDRVRRNKLLDYASRYWGRHVYTVQEQVSRAALLFLQDSYLISCAIQAMSVTTFKGLIYSKYFPRHATGLHLTAEFGLLYLSERLCSQRAGYIGAVHDSKDSYGRTPLSLAASHGHEAVVELLLDKSADVKAKDIYGQTPLWLAALGGYDKVVELLLSKDPDLNFKDHYGRTPLSLAASHGHEAVVKLLLDTDADVEAKDNHGRTPLSSAVFHGHEVVVRLLLDKNANPSSKDNRGSTPLSYAKWRCHREVVKLLLDKGAENS